MVGVSTKESLERYMARQKEGDREATKKKHVWTVHPKPGACDACLDMAKEVHTEEPERPHPNCKCVILKHDAPEVKTDMFFDGAKICIKGGPCFDANSGPHGKGALPPGTYTVVSGAIAFDKTEKNAGYCDEKGFCWWVRIEPDFDAGGRHGFGIHPDGNGPGTRGCIGIEGEDAKSAYDAFKNLKGKKIQVE